MADTRSKTTDSISRNMRHPAVNELSDIFETAFALADRIAEWRRTHRGGCRCACCRFVKASMAGGPDVYDFLTAIEAVIWASSAAQEDRPRGMADIRAMNERDEARRQKGGA